MSEEPKLWGKCPKIIRVRNCKSDSHKAKNTSDPHHNVAQAYLLHSYKVSVGFCFVVVSKLILKELRSFLPGSFVLVESNEKMVIHGD